MKTYEKSYFGTVCEVADNKTTVRWICSLMARMILGVLSRKRPTKGSTLVKTVMYLEKLIKEFYIRRDRKD